jgi:NAD(P)-dependent dehydrogenase (short-subunit alcohol dehydrogenase family)
VDLGLRGRVVLVTGAGQGLGRAIGEAFAAEGAHVAFHYRTSSGGAEEAAAQARARGVKAIAVGADLRDGPATAAMVDRVEKELGPVGVLINNAAAVQRKPFLETTPEDWQLQVDTTVIGTLRVTQEVVRRMKDHGGGAIVSLMGDSGRVGESGLLVTATVRSTTVGLSKSLAKELARYGIRANAVSIALVKTPAADAHSGVSATDEVTKRILAQYPLRRFGVPDDVWPTVLLLASPRASWITGQVWSVNGGYSMP